MSGREPIDDPTRHARRPSQILFDPNGLEGDLATWANRRRHLIPHFVYTPGTALIENHGRGGILAQASPPTVTWQVGADRTGLLSPMGFIGLWNQDLDEIDGSAISLEVRPGPAIALPWIWPHPSGCLQAVRFEIDTQTFMRRILYPIRRRPDEP